MNPATGMDAREAALEALAAVLERGRPLDESFGAADVLPDARDRAFARALSATCLRRLGQIDSVIDGFLESPLPGKAARARQILRLGLAQLLFMETPAHAAVDTAVRMAARQAPAHKNLVNALLRRAVREGANVVSAQDAERINTPDWLWRSWCAAYGEETSRRIARAHLGEAPLDIFAPNDAAQWAEKLNATLLPTGAIRRDMGGAVFDLPGFSEGAWWVQDAAAQLPVKLLGDAKDQTIADLCAAPGGKTAQLAALGAQVTAVDRSDQRMKRLRENLARTHLTAETHVADAAAWKPDRLFDGVLLDAPCSATGTARRHPDILRLKSQDEVLKLSAVQERLLRAAADMVKPSGIIIYCVCSLEPAEGPETVERLLAQGLPLARMPIAPEEIGGLAEAVTPQGDLRTLPCHLAKQGGMDGFYAARLKRR